MKNNKNILLAVIGGIVACVVCAGIVFLYPKSETNNLKGNNYEEEILLGDDPITACATTARYCSVGYLSGTHCYSNPSSANYLASDCDADGGYFVNGKCYFTERSSDIKCTSCSAGSYLTSTLGGGANCHYCPAGYKCPSQTGDKVACNGAGEYQDTTGQTTCKTCNTVGYAPNLEHTACEEDPNQFITCDPGEYSTGRGSCDTCPSGYYCPGGHYYIGDSSRSGVFACDNNLTSDPGATKASDCHAAATPTATATVKPTVYGCCLSFGGSTWYFIDDLESCSDLGATANDTEAACLAKNATPSPSSSTGPTPTPKPCSEQCANAGSQYNYCMTQCTGSPYPPTSPTTRPSTGPTTSPTTRPSISPTPTATTTNPTATATTQPKACASITGSTSCLARDDCEWDYTNGCHNKPQSCTTANTYWNGTECISCPNGFKATATVPTCHMVIPAGSYYNPSQGSTVISTCPAGTYSSGGYYYASGNSNPSSLTHCTSCPSGTTSPMGSKSIKACTAPSGECSLTVTSTATRVSPSLESGSCKQDDRYPDTWTVTVKVTGDGCTGGKLTMSGSGAERTGSGGTITVTDGQTINFLYRATTCCTSATATATLEKDGKTIATGSKTVETSNGWRLSTADTCVSVSEYNSNPHSYKEADDLGLDIYYIAKNNTREDCKGDRVVDIYTRGCGSTGRRTYSFCCAKDDGTSYSWRTGQSSRTCPSGYTIDTSKNENTCKTVAVPACYVDGDEGYHWTNDPEPSWIKVAGVTKETDCKKEETPACYKDPKGEYKWGLYAKVEGYTFITSITTQDKCKSEGACYKNNFDIYKWSETKPDECIQKNSCWVPQTNPEVGNTCTYNDQASCEATEGYKEVPGATKPEDCAPDEAPACYVHGQEFVWGKYENVTGYIKLDGIDAKVYCKLPTDDACYKDPDGAYVWGDYSNDEGYKLIASITSIDKCNKDVPTPSTGLDVSKVVYIFMAVLMAFGIGFIYYSSVMKKENQ